MEINRERLEKALQTLSKDDDAYVLKGKFLNFVSNVRLKYFTQVETLGILGFISFIMYDINDLNNILDRMQWQLELWKTNKINIGGWMGFTKLDIELFHIKIRSIFDYLRARAPKPSLLHALPLSLSHSLPHSLSYYTHTNFREET